MFLFASKRRLEKEAGKALKYVRVGQRCSPDRIFDIFPLVRRQSMI
ncbi:hypothetical protein FG91_03012 [Sphingopyxis sp. LC81]|nr:hypothetical protein FG91_03012 [Sphingopyxis sp. LC81]